MKEHNGTQQKLTKQDIAYEKLRKDILSRKLKPQELLIESKLCEELGISRTPVRGALQRLCYEGLIDYIPDKGMFVSQLRFTDILEISEVRIPTECFAVRLATQRMSDEEISELGQCLAQHRKAWEDNKPEEAFAQDDRFHKLIAAGSKNTRLQHICEDLIDQSARGTYLTVHDSDRIHVAVTMHTATYEAIQKRDPEAAAEKHQAHLLSWVEYTKNEQINNFYIFK